MRSDVRIFLILFSVLSLPSSHQEDSQVAMSGQEGESTDEDPCLYTYKAFQPNLSSIKEKVAFITVNRCQQERQERERKKKRRQSQKKNKNKDAKLVLKSLETKTARRGKSKRRSKTDVNRREGRRKRKKKRTRGSGGRRGKEHQEFKDWKRFVATKSHKDQAVVRSDSQLKGSSKWRKLLRQRQSGGLAKPQHISHHLG